MFKNSLRKRKTYLFFTAGTSVVVYIILYFTVISDLQKMLEEISGEKQSSIPYIIICFFASAVNFWVARSFKRKINSLEKEKEGILRHSKFTNSQEKLKKIERTEKIYLNFFSVIPTLTHGLVVIYFALIFIKPLYEGF